LSWYDQNARRLPWRGEGDPYRIWISEIMLQQTRIETMIPYYQRWLERFPTLQDLANASLQDVLHIWEGLGYYSRARHLHRAARMILDDLDGHFPSDRDGLAKLPGVGRYTAGAIASIAFGQDEPALDGNIRRVFSRVMDLQVPARSKEGKACYGSSLPIICHPGEPEIITRH
jgi:A/G-specific adenine glycosylase